MATSVDPASLVEPVLIPDAPRDASRPRRPAWIRRAAVLLTLLVLGSLSLWYASTHAQGWFSAAPDTRVLTQRVVRGDLLITVVEDGNVESAANVDLKCEVTGGSVILWIVPDGSFVKKGDKIVELDPSPIDEQINQQTIVVERARATLIQAEKEFSAAEISVKEYIDGTYLKDLAASEAQIKIALENQRSAENTLLHTERMARKGYVTSLQLESQRFAVERSKLDRSAAEQVRHVLETYTKPKMFEDLKSKRDSSEARVRSETAALELERQRLERLKTQRDKCLIYAPQDGMVIYANDSSSSRGSSSSVKVEEGAGVRERQTLIRLPDLSQMQVRTLVHESKIEFLRVGLPTHIKFQDREYKGRVKFVANQPEPGSFFSANVKEYAAQVLILGEVQDLRPGMTAEIEVLVDHLHDVLSVPVQAVVEQGTRRFCWVKNGALIERRPVVTGATNNERIVIKDGLTEDDNVILNPRAVVNEARQQEQHYVEQQVDAKQKFGETAPAAAPGGEQGKSGASSKGSMPNFSDLDKNGDQKITRDEVADNERLAGSFDRIDSNSDAAITASEWSAFRARVQSMLKQQQPTPSAP